MPRKTNKPTTPKTTIAQEIAETFHKTSNLADWTGAFLPKFVKAFGVTTDDVFSIRGTQEFVHIRINYAAGTTMNFRMFVRGASDTDCGTPVIIGKDVITKEERDRLINTFFHKYHHSQSEIADMLDVSQALVSNVLRALR